MKTIAWATLCVLLPALTACASDWAGLDGASGNIFKVDVGGQSFELLKETEYAPKTDIGQSRFTVHWDDATRVVQVSELECFDGLSGPVAVEFKGVNQANRNALQAGKSFEARVATVFVGRDLPQVMTDDGNRVVGKFTPSHGPNSRSGTFEFQGKRMPVSLRERHWRIHQHTPMDPSALASGFWLATIQGSHADQRFTVSQMEVSPLEDPRSSDDPALPRVLIIGDSISMNYFDAVKQELRGVANIHRNQGNAFSTAQGVRNMELWLGDYHEAGFHWDVVQFNHCLHDLKQAYDADRDAFGAYAVPLADYQANLEKEIGILKQTGAQLIWCTTTPVPNHNKGKYARRKGASADFNNAAQDVIGRHPDVLVTDLYGTIQDSPVFDDWRTGVDVHFYQESEQQALGQAVAATIRKALAAKSDLNR